MQIESLSNESWRLTNPGGNVPTGQTAMVRIPTTTSPMASLPTGGVVTAGDGVIAFGHGGGAMSPLNLMLIPIGVGAGGIITIKIIGWRATDLTGRASPALWVPVTLATYVATLGTETGIANSDLGTTTLFATTITMTGGPTFVTSGAAPIVPDWFQISPTGNPIGMIVQRSFGFRFLEVTYDTSNGGQTQTANGLYCKM